MKRLRLLIASAFVLIGFVATPLFSTPVNAQPVVQFAICKSDFSVFGFAPWYACLPGGDVGQPRLTRLEDFFLIIFPLLESLVKIGALVAVGYIFYALFNMITARGNIKKVAKAGETIRDAVIGFVICLISVAIVNFVAGRFTPQ